jgi:hypothetical protein
MNKKIIITATILILISQIAFGLQDINITVRNTKGLCLYSEDVNCQTCDNETMILSGTSDHMIHLTNQKPYGNCDNWTIDSNETIRTYISGEKSYDYVRFGLFFAIFISGFLLMRGRQ